MAHRARRCPDSPINGLFDPNKNSRVAGYIFNEFKFSNTTKAQIAGRIEQVNLSGTTPESFPTRSPIPTAIGPATPRNLSFTPKSASVGLIQNLPWDLAAAQPRNTSSARRSRRSYSRGALMTRRRHLTSATQI